MRATRCARASLAFVAALQVLSPAQRAALLLRDVVGLSAEQTAEALGQSVSATNSALHRARSAIDGKVSRRDPASFADVSPDEVLARYVRALADHDIDAMIALMHDEMHTTMPPSPTWLDGYVDNAAFYRRMFEGWKGQAVHAVPIGVNGGFGLEFHRGGVMRAVEAIEVRDGKLLRVHHFMQPAVIALFARRACGDALPRDESTF